MKTVAIAAITLLLIVVWVAGCVRDVDVDMDSPPPSATTQDTDIVHDISDNVHDMPDTSAVVSGDESFSEMPVTTPAPEVLPSIEANPPDATTDATLDAPTYPAPPSVGDAPFSPYPLELPHETPTVADSNYIAPVSDMDLSRSGVYKIQENMTYLIDLDGDGRQKPLTIRNSSYTADFLWGYDIVPITVSGTVWVEYSGEKVELSFESIAYAAIMRREDSSCALFMSSNEYDQPYTTILSVKDGSLTIVDNIRLQIAALQYFSMDLFGDIYYFLGNQHLSGTVGLASDFSIIYPEGGWFNVKMRTSTMLSKYQEYKGGNGVYGDYVGTEYFYDADGFIYTARIDLPLKRIVGEEYKAAVLQAGTRIRPLKMNIELTRAIVESSDGRLWLLEPEHYPDTGQSISFKEDAIFDGCTHAGP